MVLHPTLLTLSQVRSGVGNEGWDRLWWCWMHSPESLVKGIWILQPSWQCHSSTYCVPGPFLICHPSSYPIWDFFFLLNEILSIAQGSRKHLYSSQQSLVGASTFPATQTKGQLTWVSGGMCCSQMSGLSDQPECSGGN